MNRRNALNRVAWLVGGTLSVPTLIACSEKKAETADLSSATSFVLNEQQQKIVAEVAEHIIPKTTTAGAKDAGVPAFIVMMLKDCYKAPEHESFMEGIATLEKANFLTQTKEQQIATLTKLESDTKVLMKEYEVKSVKVGDNVDKESMAKKAKGLPFWRLTKELTLLGYYTSKEGIEQNFDYQPIPGKFEATKYTKGQKAFAY
jgi:hypothetical protein